mgnify:CR=1 FL=1
MTILGWLVEQIKPKAKMPAWDKFSKDEVPPSEVEIMYENSGQLNEKTGKPKNASVVLAVRGKIKDAEFTLTAGYIANVALKLGLKVFSQNEAKLWVLNVKDFLYGCSAGELTIKPKVKVVEPVLETVQ